MTQQSKYLGRGLYTFGQAARLLRVPVTVLRYWIGERSGFESIIHRQLSDEHVLTFAELMELHFVKLFRDQDLSLQAIRSAAKAASQKFGAEYPFTVQRFDTDGKTIFATLRRREQDPVLVEDLRRGQLVFPTIIRPFFKKLEYLQDGIGRFWPLKSSSRNWGRVVLDPERRFGQPLDSETGVPTESIRQAVTAGKGQDVKTVAKWFVIPVEAVKAAMKYEKSLAP